MSLPLDVPPHLRKYVVRQKYEEYTVEDQAVWRFVLLQTYPRLLRSAHPSYAAGFEAAGISVERIPRIDEMSERLAQSGFAALCVDGFIPPRAFQAFQARGLLPIAADIRTSKHLTYTPAPDIIHEAAGHAPFLAHPDYAHFLRRIGAAGENAFTDPHDQAVYEAIYLLSELKENPHSSSEQIASAEARLAALNAKVVAPSEAARLSRLYWWTVEYGLVGTPTDYRLFGAGLLSSIGEGHFCHDPRVIKLPLDERCVECAYDITQPQPQLFVARDFEDLDRVLERVANTLAFRIGGNESLSRALQSCEPACIELRDGVQLAGDLRAVQHEGADVHWLELSGPCAVAFDDSVLADMPRPDGYVLPLGRLRDGTSLSEVTRASLGKWCDSQRRLQWSLTSGVEVAGDVTETVARAGRVRVVVLRNCEITARGRSLWRSHEPYPLLLAERVVTARAALPLGFHAATEFAESSVPKPRAFSPEQRGLIDLYEQALAALRQAFGSQVVPRFESIAAVLDDRYPDEWLLRWNLLESLIKLSEGGAPLAARLQDELERLEIRFAHREPIATGLAYLRALGAVPKAAESGGQT